MLKAIKEPRPGSLLLHIVDDTSDLSFAEYSCRATSSPEIECQERYRRQAGAATGLA